MYYPVALDLKGKRVVVIGGDSEAVRKTASLLACGAEVTVVTAAPDAAIERWAEADRLTLVPREYRNGDLADAFLAVVCGVSHADAARREADRCSVLLNVLDQKELCDFIAVATFSRDGLQFGIHSSGKSAALTRRIRERLQRQFPEHFAAVTRTLGEIRPEVRKLIAGAEDRRCFWLNVVDEALLDRLQGGLSPEVLREEILAAAIQFVENGSPRGRPELNLPEDPASESLLEETSESCRSR